MKTNYFTKVENKYVFNVSLIFWHIFIGLSTLIAGVCIIILLWGIIPPSERKVKKQVYPEKTQYPEPVKVSLNELKLDDTKNEIIVPKTDPVQIYKPKPKEAIYEDLKGKTEYEESMKTLKNLIPPTKYSWSGSGYYSYPYGDRYWNIYQKEEYRRWNITKDGIEDLLKSSYKKANAKSYIEIKQVLDGYITVLKNLPEDKRFLALDYLIDNVTNNVSNNVNICESISKVVGKMNNKEDINYINRLAAFGNYNKNDGYPFIDYISTIIEKFDSKQQAKIIDLLTNSYYNYFNQNITTQKEATNLFIPLLSQIEGDKHHKALVQYYGLFVNKNRSRNNAIAQIENEYQQKIYDIEQQYNNEVLNAQFEYQEKKQVKQQYRIKSLIGIGSAILFIVLIATILAFLSIQRSVSKIEEKILS